MRTVLSVHNHYQHPGGEDQVFAAETELLQRNGHSVIRYEEHNNRIGASNSFAAGVGTVWSRTSYVRLQSVARLSQPDIAHFHNTFPLISPAAYYAVRRRGVPVVQTLHNYRLLCVNAIFYRDGRPCEDCLGTSPWRGVVHGCYRGNRAASLAVASMLQYHRARKTWTNAVDTFIALTPAARDKFIRGGLPAERIVVKPNFVDPDPGVGSGGGGYAIFAGRLVQEKGIQTMLDAWDHLPHVPLRIFGQGPLARVRQVASVTWMGHAPHDQVMTAMKSAQVLVLPSTWYEGAPGTILEAFASGLPVIASNLGAMASMIQHGRTGLLFRPGDPEDLARQVRWAFEHPEALQEMRVAARREFEEKYTAERNYKMLMAIYDRAIESAKARRRAGAKPIASESLVRITQP